MSDAHYEIRFSGTGSTVTTEFFPMGTTEAIAKSIARDYKADLWKGFISLREVREINIFASDPEPEVPSV